MLEDHNEGLQGSAGSGLPVRTMSLVLFGLAAVALVVVILEVAALRPRHDDVEQRAADRAAVLSAAQRFVVQWNTFDPAALDDYKTRVGKLMSTKFRSEFETQFVDVSKVVVASKMSSSGTVLKSGVATLDPDSAQVLVVADAAVSTTSDKRQRHFRWEIDLVKVRGDWLVDSWDAVQDPAAAVTQ
jgi:Mce-associated membrane protein